MRLMPVLLLSLTLLPLNVLAQTGDRKPFRGPPPEATEACSAVAENAECRFESPHGTIEGFCRHVPEGVLACVPMHHRRPPPDGSDQGGMPPRSGDFGPSHDDFARRGPPHFGPANGRPPLPGTKDGGEPQLGCGELRIGDACATVASPRLERGVCLPVEDEVLCVADEVPGF